MIITDSLGAPRKDLEIIHFQDTWPYMVFNLMLENQKYLNFIYTQKALDSDELKRLVDMNLDLYDKKVIFIHLGIVDCVRRAMSKNTLRVVSIIPVIRNITYFIAKRFHSKLTRLYNVNYVPIKRFEKNIMHVLSKFNEAEKIYVIPIIPAGLVQQKKSYKVQEQIIKYNGVLRDVCNSLDNAFFVERVYNSFFPLNEENYTSDGYHISKKGHKVIFNELKKIVGSGH
jgi:lysophospholipase L1-like esterase